MTPSEKLRQILATLAPALERATASLVEHPQPGTVYLRYLVALHTTIRASVPLMVTAHDRVLRDYADDPVGVRLADYLRHHIPEELHHDEWVLEDLESLGVDRRHALDHQPSPTAAALVGAQYYYIQHTHPVALLGYLGLLEMCAPGPARIRRLMRRTGYPPEGFRTALEHAQLDVGHGEDLADTLDAMPLTRQQVSLLSTNAIHSAGYVIQLTREVVTGHAYARFPHEPSEPAANFGFS